MRWRACRSSLAFKLIRDRHPVLLENADESHDIVGIRHFARIFEEIVQMAEWLDPQQQQAQASIGTVGADAGAVAYDAGLRSYMLKVYNYMGSGILLTGIVAMLFAQTEMAQQIMYNGGLMRWIIMLSPLAVVFAMSFGVNRMSTTTIQALFWAFTVLMGLSMSTIFFTFTGTSIAETFFATAAAFVGLSLYGYTTQRNLTGMGSFLIMGLVGLIVASIINIFLQSGTLHWVISCAGVLIFAGLTAYDTQKIKSMYQYVQGTDMVGKTAIMGALTLYLDFINMFQFLLSFMGSRD
jgi:FtsH-binding integral membrane protein